MEEETEINIDPDFRCNVCAGVEFNLREGFFYCQECGTKQDQVRAIEVERDAEFNDNVKHVKKQKIRITKPEKPELTSWECYNYILRGFVEELLSLGAKEELKLMTLQVWAAYLRRMEVAFFSKKNAELPKLGVRYLKSDASTLYNHDRKLRKKRTRRCIDADETSIVSGGGRAWRKSMQKLDESVYSQHSASQTETSGGDLSRSQRSFSSGTTGRAIRLKFSAKARKYLKRVMPRKHLAKHELDAESRLDCHKINPKVRSLNRMEHAVSTINIKQLYAILAIALNLVEDNMQLSDLVRFIGEGHVSTKNVLQYFPENVVPQSKQLLRDIKFYLYPERYSDKVLREHVGLLAKCINISEFKKPNIYKLALRYLTELNLPGDMANFVERLINLQPPQMKTPARFYPHYEARAMAYVVFVLKLLFGLDGHKELRISASAQCVNRKMQQFGEVTDKHAPLFVWSEWVEYVELRKVIVSQYNSNFCRQFKQMHSTTQLLEERSDDLQRLSEQEMLPGNIDVNAPTSKVANMQSIFNNFQQTHRLESNAAGSSTTPAASSIKCIKFPPSFTPAHSYFKRILLNFPSIATPSAQLHVDHAKRTLQPYLSVKALRQYFSIHQCHLKVLPIACTNNRSYVGIFRVPVATRSLRVQEADFEISEEQWLKNIKDDYKVDELEFKANLDRYKKRYMLKLKANAQLREQCEGEGNPTLLLNCQKKRQRSLENEDNRENIPVASRAVFSEKINARSQGENYDMLSMYSIDVFRETDMEPIENLNLDAPRRQLDSINLFGHLSDENGSDSENLNVHDTEIKKKADENENAEEKQTTLITSKMDCWLLLGNMNALNEMQKKVLESKFTRSFFWLLETCANTIGVDWSVLYEQLLAIELMFVYGIEDLHDFQNCIRFKYNHPIKDINMLVNCYRKIW